MLKGAGAVTGIGGTISCFVPKIFQECAVIVIQVTDTHF